MGGPLLVGWLADHFSYTPACLIVGAMAPLGAIGHFAIMRRIERVPDLAA